MNILRTPLIILLLTSIVFPAPAQKDPAAEPYLEKIASELGPGKAIHIQFDYIREDQQSGSKVDGEGSLFLSGEKYKIDLGEAVIFYDGETQYAWQREIEEVYVSKPDPESKEFVFADPIRLLADYKETFKYRLMGESELMGIAMHEVQLYPVELDAPYALIKTFFDLQNDDLKAIFIRQNQGILYTMMITNLTRENVPEDAYFRFNAGENPNVEVIELLN
ncbi:MAG: outer membrane lipoprotein carrier protein LolA [Bacteroidales bacterium]|nr:outer membrane lipoprotein carrier protein LolA [Bacteroidales bacterium]